MTREVHWELGRPRGRGPRPWLRLRAARREAPGSWGAGRRSSAALHPGAASCSGNHLLSSPRVGVASPKSGSGRPQLGEAAGPGPRRRSRSCCGCWPSRASGSSARKHSRLRPRGPPALGCACHSARLAPESHLSTPARSATAPDLRSAVLWEGKEGQRAGVQGWWAGSGALGKGGGSEGEADVGRVLCKRSGNSEKEKGLRGKWGLRRGKKG